MYLLYRRLCLVTLPILCQLAANKLDRSLAVEDGGPDAFMQVSSSMNSSSLLNPTSFCWWESARDEQVPAAKNADQVPSLSQLSELHAEYHDEEATDREVKTEIQGKVGKEESLPDEGSNEEAHIAAADEFVAIADGDEETTFVQASYSLDEKQTGPTLRNEYTPPRFIVDSVHLVFKLDEEVTQVTSKIVMRRRSTKYRTDLVLDGNNLELLDITLDGRHWVESGKSTKPCSGEGVADEKFYYFDDGKLVIPEAFLHRSRTERIIIETTVNIKPNANRGLKGLYTSGNTLVTQCEPEGFRRITYFLDRPDVLARYTVRLEAEKAKYPVLLSNGNKVDSGAVRGRPDHHFAVFEDPFPKPSYLFAIVAGDLAFIEDSFVTQSGRKVLIRLLSEPSQVRKLKWALESVKKSMQWDEQAFGREYDLDVFNVACVSDFNAGAMENKGLNIFNCNLLLADTKTATDADFERVLAIIGHEYFHNWTGNRVTVRDWFQLTLKEGLTVYREQLFMSTVASPSVQRIQDVSSLISRQFAEDDSPMSHSIRPDSYLSVENFYTATVYDKGAEVVQMYHTLLGPRKFRDGMKLFFERNDGKAVTCEEFRSAMEDASGQYLGQFSRWYSQAGTPQLEVLGTSYNPSRKVFMITFRQHTPSIGCQPDKLPQVIPIRLGLIGKSSKRDLLPSVVLPMTKAEQRFSIPDVKEDCVPSILRGLSAPVKLIYPGQRAEDLAFLMAYDVDPVNKWMATNTLTTQIICERVRLAASNPYASFNSLPEFYIEAMREMLLQRRTDNALTALTLNLPDWNVLVRELRPVNPDVLHRAIRSVSSQLAAALHSELLQIYFDLKPLGLIKLFSREESSRRRLRNAVLRLLSEARDTQTPKRAFNHFKMADNMTDKYAALLVLTNIESNEREKAFSTFYDEAMGDKLVIDKWFKAQAVSDLPDQVERVAKLMKHRDFSFENPNRMQSLIHVFAASNKIHFHRRDGMGYSLMSDSILEVDKFNPLAAARLAKTLMSWNDYDASRQVLMKQQLHRIFAQPMLSNNVREVVMRALGIRRNGY